MQDSLLIRPWRERETMQDDPDSWPSEGYEAAIIKHCTRLYDAAKQENDDDDQVRNIAKMIDYIGGRQWKAGLRVAHKSKPVLNRINRILDETVGLLTDIRPSTRVNLTDSSDRGLARQAKNYNRMIRNIWSEPAQVKTLVMVIIHAMMTTGYIKLDWDHEAHAGMGDFDFVPLGANSVFPIRPNPKDIQSGMGVIYASCRTMDWLQERFPLQAYRIQPDEDLSRSERTFVAPSNMSAQMFSTLSPTMQRLVGTSALSRNEGIPMAKYREFWLRDYQRNTSDQTVTMGNPGTNWCYEVPPGARLYPRGRLIIIGGEDVLLHDGPNPWWHGKFPFAALRLKLRPWSFLGASQVLPLIPTQDLINDVLAGVIDLVKLAVNPGIMAPSNAMGENAFRALDPSKPGFKLMYKPNAVTPPQFTRQPNLPGFVLNVLGIASKEQDFGSGIAAYNQMIGKKQVPGGDTFDQVRNAQNTPIRLQGRMIEAFMEEVGELLLPSIAQFYTLQRRILMLGMDGITDEDTDWDAGSMVPAGMSVQDYIRQFEFKVVPDSLLRINQMDKVRALFELRKMGDVDRQTLIESMDMGLNYDTIIARMKQEALMEHNINELLPHPVKGHKKK